MLFHLILFLAIGLLLLVLGFLIWKKQRVQLIHSYHHSRVKEEDKKAYTKGIGQALMLLGAGCLMTGLVNFLGDTWRGWWAFVVAFLAFLGLALRAQRRYNR